MLVILLPIFQEKGVIETKEIKSITYFIKKTGNGFYNPSIYYIYSFFRIEKNILSSYPLLLKKYWRSVPS